jgi:hypothetical protein
MAPYKIALIVIYGFDGRAQFGQLNQLDELGNLREIHKKDQRWQKTYRISLDKNTQTVNLKIRLQELLKKRNAFFGKSLRIARSNGCFFLRNITVQRAGRCPIEKAFWKVSPITRKICHLLVLYEIIQQDLLLGGLLLLLAEGRVQSHDDGPHETALEGVPQELGDVTHDGLERNVR